MYALILIFQLLPPLPEPLSFNEPTLACKCEVCECPSCDCRLPTIETPAVVSVRKPRIDEFSPITLAPDPAYDDAIAAFTERWKDPNRKTYVGKQLSPEPTAVGAKAKTSSGKQPSVSNPSPAAVSSGTRGPPAISKQPSVLPIEQAAMKRVWVCSGGVCQWEFVPATQAPTKSVRQQSYQRSRFRIFRRR